MKIISFQKFKGEAEKIWSLKNKLCNCCSECKSFSFHCTLTNGKLIKVYTEITDVKKKFCKNDKSIPSYFISHSGDVKIIFPANRFLI